MRYSTSMHQRRLWRHREHEQGEFIHLFGGAYHLRATVPNLYDLLYINI